MPLPSPLRVLFLCSEADPLVKVGGLGDVGGSLPPALRSLKYYDHVDGTPQPVDIDIRLVIPFHGVINQQAYKPTKVCTFSVKHRNGPIEATAYQVEFDLLPVYLISGEPINLSVPVYSNDLGYDAHKYIFFSLAAVELARQIGFEPHIVHANDWHTSAAIYWLFLNQKTDQFFKNTATLLSVHNLPFLGVGGNFPMDSFFLPPAPEGTLPDWARQLPLPLGLYSADRINTVSPTYGKEILTPEFGAGLEKFLQTRTDSISGILNGIDPERWNPGTDPFLFTNYSSDTLDRRKKNKAALLDEVGFGALPDKELESRVPLLAMITRMDYQKGIDLVVEALEQLGRQAKYAWRALILGTGLPELEEAVRELQDHYPEQVRAFIKFDAPLSHRIYAGADILLMPSRYEPCGLAQMIAMRYGCIPVARATGGLADTIVDASSLKNGVGFLFRDATPQAFVNALNRALNLYQDRKEWQVLQERGMQLDFSWKRSALEYLKLYQSLVADRQSFSD